MANSHCFGRVVVQPTERLLLVDGQPASVGARAFDLLLVLVADRDRLVTKDELLALAWPGAVVEEHNLQVQVSTLRKVLGPHAIATIPGRGYRLAMRMDEDEEGAEPAPLPPPTSRSASPEPTPQRPDTKPSVVLLPFSAWGESGQGPMLAAAAADEIACSLAKLTGLSVVTSVEAAVYSVSGRLLKAVGRVRATVHLVDRRRRRLQRSARPTGTRNGPESLCVVPVANGATLKNCGSHLVPAPRGC